MSRLVPEKTRVDCKVIGDVGKALHIQVEDGPKMRDVFLPISHVHEIHKQDGWVVISEWLAQKENLE